MLEKYLQFIRDPNCLWISLFAGSLISFCHLLSCVKRSDDKSFIFSGESSLSGVFLNSVGYHIQDMFTGTARANLDGDNSYDD